MASSIVFQAERAIKFFQDLERNYEAIERRRRAYIGGVSAFVYKDVIDHFEKESGPEGKWTKWSPKYGARQSSLGYKQILQVSGRLRQSFKPTNVRTVGLDLVWYNNAQTKKGFPYAYHHDEGPSDGSKPRQFMWLSDNAFRNIANFTLSYLFTGKG